MVPVLFKHILESRHLLEDMDKQVPGYFCILDVMENSKTLFSTSPALTILGHSTLKTPSTLVLRAVIALVTFPRSENGAIEKVGTSGGPGGAENNL